LYLQNSLLLTVTTLVTQPMLQCRPNRTELRLMDSYIQILCTFQKCKRKVPPLSVLKNKKGVFFSNKFYFPEIFFSVILAKVIQFFTYWKQKKIFGTIKILFQIFFFESSCTRVPYESPVLGQLLDLISPPKINTSEPRFESYDPCDMANWPAMIYYKHIKV
jgi:hypothetical protein